MYAVSHSLITSPECEERDVHKPFQDFSSNYASNLKSYTTHILLVGIWKCNVLNSKAITTKQNLSIASKFHLKHFYYTIYLRMRMYSLQF